MCLMLFQLNIFAGLLNSVKIRFKVTMLTEICLEYLLYDATMLSEFNLKTYDKA